MVKSTQQRCFYKILPKGTNSTVEITYFPCVSNRNLQNYSLYDKWDYDILVNRAMEYFGEDILLSSDTDTLCGLVCSWLFNEYGIEDEKVFAMVSKGLNSALFSVGRTPHSLHRTKRNFFDLAMCNDFDYFVTFTCSPKIVSDRENLAFAKNKLRNAIKQFNRKYDAHISYLLIPEPHKNGAWHFHQQAARSRRSYI